MDLYSKTSYSLSAELTKSYSTSFSSATRLFSPEIREHIYAIYGLLRIADEIVDTYTGKDAAVLLQDLENETKSAIDRAYSVNPIVHAYALTAQKFSFDNELIDSFFSSMNVDAARRKKFTQQQYEAYIIGSAEVVGLMCLKVFVNGDANEYNALEPGARKLGAAYQKINFLRDFSADYHLLGRIYFPNVSKFPLQEDEKLKIIEDIRHDLQAASPYIAQLPRSTQRAVELSRLYYQALLSKLEKTPASVINQTRISVSQSEKSRLAAKVYTADYTAKFKRI